MKTEELLGLYIGQLIYDIDADKTYSWDGEKWNEIPNIGHFQKRAEGE